MYRSEDTAAAGYRPYRLKKGEGNHGNGVPRYEDQRRQSGNLILARLMEQFIEWERKTSPERCHHNYTDTYARLLYKIGEKEDAIRKQKEAIDLYLNCGKGRINDDKYNDYSSALNRMQNGEELSFK